MARPQADTPLVENTGPNQEERMKTIQRKKGQGDNGKCTNSGAFPSFTLSYIVLTHIHSPLPSPKIWTPTLKAIKDVPQSTFFPHPFFSNFAQSPGDFPDN
jgi:hypothetical protein